MAAPRNAEDEAGQGAISFKASVWPDRQSNLPVLVMCAQLTVLLSQ